MGEGRLGLGLGQLLLEVGDRRRVSTTSPSFFLDVLSGWLRLLLSR